MVTTHSAYRHILSGEDPSRLAMDSNSCKAVLLRLVRALILKDPKNCCQTDILRDIVLNYHGTVSDEDLAALEIFRIYEEVASLSMSPFLTCWANSGELNFSECLNSIDITMMANSIHWYDGSRDIEQVYVSSNNVFASGLHPLYDQNFFYPLIANILSQNAQIDVHRLIDSNMIGFVVMGLSSKIENTRKAANLILSKFSAILRECELKEKNQTLLLLDFLRNSLLPTDEEPYPIVPSLIASFVAQGLMILMKPESHFYPLINRFCLQRATIDLNDVPMFYEMIYSQYSNYKTERGWILKLLFYGLNTAEDYKLFKRRHVIDLLIGLFQSPLSDNVCRKQVFKVFPILILDFIQSKRDPICNIWYDYKIGTIVIFEKLQYKVFLGTT
jgi:hypothetical protein